MGRDALIKGIQSLKVGERFRITNEDPPDWVKGLWEISDITENSISCKKILDKS